jgi:hypothetical protein
MSIGILRRKKAMNETAIGQVLIDLVDKKWRLVKHKGKTFIVTVEQL